MEKLNNINFNNYIKKDNSIDDELDYTNIEYTEYTNDSNKANYSKSNIDISVGSNDISIDHYLKDNIKYSNSEDSKNSYDDLKILRNDLKESYDDLKNPHDDLIKSIDDLKNPHDDLKIPHDDLKKSIDGFKSQHDDLKEKPKNLTRNIKVSDKLDMNLYFQNNEDKYFILSLLNNLNDISNTYSTIAKSMEYFIHSLEQSKDRILNSDNITSKNFIIDLLTNLVNIISVELDSNQFFRKSTNFYINNKLIYTTPIINFEINDNLFQFEFTQNNKLEFNIDLSETDRCYLIDNSIDTINNIYEHTNNLFNKLSILINYLNIKKCN